MIIFLALVLIILMILIGGERGAVSLMTLAGNIVILFISITGQIMEFKDEMAEDMRAFIEKLS